MGGSGFFDSFDGKSNTPTGKRLVSMSDIIEGIAERHTYGKIHETTVQKLEELIQALEHQRAEGETDKHALTACIHKLAEVTICLETYAKYWELQGGVELEEEITIVENEKLQAIAKAMI